MLKSKKLKNELKDIQSVFINNVKRYFLIDELNQDRETDKNKYTNNWNKLFNSWSLQRGIFRWSNRRNLSKCFLYWNCEWRSRYRKKNLGIYRAKHQQKKASEEKHDVLKDSIFTPLSTVIISHSDSKPDGIPYLIFDPLEIHKTEPNHFEEAKKHFKKIKILKRFEDLEQSVNTFNKKLDMEDDKITKIVSDYLKEKDFDVYKDGSIPSKENTVLINNLIPELKLFWSRKMFNYIQEVKVNENGKKELRIKGALIIIVSDKDKEKEIRECIECLKHNQTINEEYDSFHAESEVIMREANELSSIIKRRLVDGYKK